VFASIEASLDKGSNATTQSSRNRRRYGRVGAYCECGAARRRSTFDASAPIVAWRDAGKASARNGGRSSGTSALITLQIDVTQDGQPLGIPPNDTRLRRQQGKLPDCVVENLRFHQTQHVWTLLLVKKGASSERCSRQADGKASRWRGDMPHLSARHLLPTAKLLDVFLRHKISTATVGVSPQLRPVPECVGRPCRDRTYDQRIKRSSFRWATL
jgi:hypothetical protein